MASMTDIEEIYSRCCRKLCKTDKMNDEEFDDYTSANCEDCPIGDFEQYFNMKMEAYRMKVLSEVAKALNSIRIE